MVTRARLSAHLAIAIYVEPLEKVDDAGAAGRANDNASSTASGAASMFGCAQGRRA